jgi:hypothetical protein
LSRIRPGLGWKPVASRQRLHDRAGDDILQPADDLSGLDQRRPIVYRQNEAYCTRICTSITPARMTFSR